jgi:phage gp29-like protein
MPRHVIAPPGALALRDYAPIKPVPQASATTLQKILLAAPDASKMQRTRFGRSVSADLIEVVLKRAAQGNMRDLTDLVRESIFYDPHYAGVLRKRLGTVAALPWEVRPAEGPDVDKVAARDYAALVRAQLMNMANFRDFLQDLAWGVVDGRAASEIEWVPIQPMTVGKHAATMAVTRILYIHPRRLNFGPTRALIVTDEARGSSSGSFHSDGFSLDPVDLRKQKLYRKYVQWMPRQFGDYQEMEGIGCRALIWAFFKRFAQRDRMQLLELFGKPWRVGKVEEGSEASPEDFAAAKAALDGLGATYSAMLPRGIDVDLLKPGDTAGNVHKDVIAECDRQISKLVLGQTGTTDNMAGGLNTSQAGVMQDEQFAILTTDALNMAQVIEDQVTDAIVEVNFGADQLPNAPHFVLRSDLPPNRETELKRLDLALKAGLEVEVDEAYEVSGFRRPEEGAAVVKVDQPPSVPLAVVPPQPRPVIVYPRGASPAAGEQQPIAETAATDAGSRDMPDIKIGVDAVSSIVTVNEARAAQGLPPLTLPDGQPDPLGGLTIAAATAEAAQGTGTPATPEEGTPEQVTTDQPPPTDESPTGEPSEEEEDEDVDVFVEDFAARRPFPELDDEASVIALVRAELVRVDARAAVSLAQRGHIAAAAGHRSAFGSTEEILRKGQRELASASRSWADGYLAAVRGQATPGAIYNALVRAAEQADLNAYARPLERRLRQSAALGCLDNALEAGQIDGSGERKPGWGLARSPNLAALERIALMAPFADLPFRDAMAWFRARDVMPRATFERMSADIRRRSFTVAGVQSREMLAEIQAELARQIGKGADLREFATFARDRLVAAGMVAEGAASASHIENVFRTNTANAYHAGRYTHATQPEVLRARPIWQWRCLMLPPTPDGGGSRKTHMAAHNKMLYASDPFWATCYPPAGFQCGCRVVTRDASYASQVGTAADFAGLPDPGFTSGVSALL